MKEEPNGILCVGQHFKVWYEAIKKGRMPDFGEPCESCRCQKYCHDHHYPWMNMILPVLRRQGIYIQTGDDYWTKERREEPFVIFMVTCEDREKMSYIDVEKAIEEFKDRIQKRYGVSAERLVQLAQADAEGRINIVNVDVLQYEVKAYPAREMQADDYKKRGAWME